jgi:hypothetical protein
MIVKFPVATFEAAENRMGVLEPAATLNGLDGLATTFAGKPARVIWTLPVKPLSGLTETPTAELMAPCWTFTEFTENAREKSGWGGGGGD